MSLVSEPHRQITNSGLYLASTLFSYAIPFLVLPIFTRILSPEDFGILALSGMFAAFLTTLSNFGLLTIYQRDFFQYEKNPAHSAALLYTILSFVMVIFMLVWALAYFWREALSFLIFRRSGLGLVLLTDAMAVFFSTLTQYFLLYFQNSQWASRYVRFSLASLLGGNILAVGFLVILKSGFMGMIYAKLLTDGVIFLLLSVGFLRTLPFRWNLLILKKSLTLGFPLTPNAFFKVFMRHFDKYLINLLNSTGQTGIYNIGEKFAYMGFALMTSLDQVYIPHVLKKMFALKENGGEAIGIYLTPFFYLSMLFCFLVGVFAQEMMEVLTPPSFHAAADIVLVLSIYYALLFFGKQQQLVFAGKTAALSVLFLLSMAVNVALNICFIPRWAALGAAWAACLSGFFMTALYLFLSQRAYPIHWEYRKIIVIFVAFLYSLLAVLFLKSRVPYLFLLVIKLCLLGIFIFIGVRCGVASRKNLNLLKDVFCRRLGRSGPLSPEAAK